MGLTRISGDIIQTPLNVGVVTATRIDGDINSTGVSTFSTLKVGASVDISGGIVTAPTFSGNLTGNATGLSGNPNITVGTIGATSLNATGIVTATGFVGNVTGNLSGDVTGNLNSTGVSTVTTLSATSIVGVSSVGVTTAYVTSINDGPISGARNRIINGDMRIDQRNNGSAVTSSAAYPVDRWQIGFGGAVAVSVSRSGDAPVGFTNSLYIDITTADTSITGSDFLSTSTIIEGFNISDLNWGTSNALPITISFWIKCTTAGTYAVSFRNAATVTRSYVATYSISAGEVNTWTYKTITVPGDTTGTWNSTNGQGIQVNFTFMVGPNIQSPSNNTWNSGNYIGSSSVTNLAASTANEVRITGVQLEAGTVATPFERRSFGQELALCQRYYYSTPEQGFAHPGVVLVYGNPTYSSFSIPFPVTMRVAPSGSIVLGSGDVYVTFDDGSFSNYSDGSIRTISPYAVCVRVTFRDGFNAGGPLYFQNPTRIRMSAEL
jgi:hypothetical protein